MARFKDFVPHGGIPAGLLPFPDDLSIDEPSFRSHLRDVEAVEGLSALTINAHSTEVASCTADEQSRVLEIAGEEVGDRLPLIHGLWAGGSLEAARSETRGRALQARSRPVNVLSTNSAWLLSSLVLGCNGLLSGSGSVIADLQARLYRAVKANDLAEARRLNDRIHPMARVFYADPFVDMHNRMKEALVILGRLPRAVVRPPLVKIGDPEIARIREALVAAGLLDGSGTRLEAA